MKKDEKAREKITERRQDYRSGEHDPFTVLLP